MRRTGNEYIINKLKSVVGSSDGGFGFEYAVHLNILGSIHPFVCIKLQADNLEARMQTATMQLQQKRKVLIRTVADIANLVDGDYGLPTIPNFPFVDAVIPPNMVLQMAASSKHLGAVDKRYDIAEMLGIDATDLIMIFVVPEDLMAGFRYVDNLCDVTLQYVTLSTPASKNAAIQLRKRKRTVDEYEFRGVRFAELRGGRGGMGTGRGESHKG